MSIIIKLLRNQCLPHLNQHYYALLQKTDHNRNVAQSLRDLWKVKHMLHAAADTQDIIQWLHLLDQLGNSDREETLKETCRSQAQQCFEQVLSKDWPDKQAYQQVQELLYPSSRSS
jgi:hypothetical protein